MADASQRGYKRMDDYLSFTYRMISDHDFEVLKGKYLAGTLEEEQTADTQSALYELETASDDQPVLKVLQPLLQGLFQKMSMLDRKMDTIIALLRGDKNAEAMVHQPREINISGSGCMFKTEKAPEEGTFVEIRIFLSDGGRTVVPALGKVAYVKGDEQGSYSVGVHFEAISYKSRERLIQYIFKSERALLRAQKEGDTVDQLRSLRPMK